MTRRTTPTQKNYRKGRKSLQHLFAASIGGDAV